MKTIIKVLFLCFLFIGCTKNFEDINTDPTRPSSETISDEALVNGLMRSALTNGLMNTGDFQRVQSLYCDLYSQYFATSASYFASDRYSINQGWLLFGWNLFYPRDIGNLAKIISGDFAKEEEKAMAKIFKVFLFHRYVDMYGDLPYFNVLNVNDPEKYDAQKDIYYDFFKELDDAVNSLKGASSVLPQSDIVYNGDAQKWRKFANSLRLRLAIRISKVDPDKAKKEALAAIEGGVFENNGDNAYAPVSAGSPNPLNGISGWNEFRMSASMESVLDGYKDPRLKIFFSEAVNGGYKGIRNGLPSNEIGDAANYSNVGSKFGLSSQSQTPRIIMTYAEVCFLQAEVAVNGWGSGLPKVWYETGIKASLEQFGDSKFSDKVISSEEIVQYTSGTSITTVPEGIDRPLSNLPVNFSNNELEQREQIGIQKWLAVWPDGFEGWAEFRRTGYPKFYPVPSIDPSSDVKAGDFIQRVTYLDDQKFNFAAAIRAATNRMGGDKQSTKLWFAGGK